MAGKDIDEEPATCPIPQESRAAWLEKAREAGQAVPPDHPSVPPTSPAGKILKTRPLALDRETSSIPRASIAPDTTTPSPKSRPSSYVPSNNEEETGLSASGRWIYPSEKMFFEAMKRKEYEPVATDMASIVPIHNAVNERAWQEIKAWEARFSWARDANRRCGGPRLVSFAGDSSKLTPKARWNGLWGYQKPFDRHDWIVERCPEGKGQERVAVEYVIDFYQGKGAAGNRGLSFHLDVRPKLNTWEGWRMRLLSMAGW